MCGIVGYLGSRNAVEVLISGLSKLEYRGYDSAGIAIGDESGFRIIKAKGRLKNLSDKLEGLNIYSNIGIGHTRWATHGAPSDANSHPHSSTNGHVTVVHNGIIENYLELKEWLVSEGYSFLSDTDTEIIPNLVDHYYEGNLLDAVIKTTQRLRGSYALGVLSTKEPNKIIAMRKDSPLIVGIGDGDHFIASDVPAILNYTKNVVYLNDLEFVVIENDTIAYYDITKSPLVKEIVEIQWSAEAAEKGGYDHFTMKEIHEQPRSFRDTLTSRIQPGKPVSLDDIHITREMLEGYERISIVACGTAYNAGLIGKYAIERLAKIPVEVDVASEFRYREPLIHAKTLVIVISQSGETADTLAALRDSKAKGARVIAITNVVGSSVSREADDVFYTWAGLEIGVGSTKAYLTMLAALYIIGIQFAELLGTADPAFLEEVKVELLALPDKIQAVIDQKKPIQEFATRIMEDSDVYFLGRGLDYAVAMEAALKLKELSYIHAEAYPGGELKHGPIALITEGVSVVASVTQRDLYEKMQSNIQEVVSRGATVMAITLDDNKELHKYVDTLVKVPSTMDILAPVLSVIPLQLLAYYVATYKGLDVDKPRNLAKSVTVE